MRMHTHSDGGGCSILYFTVKIGSNDARTFSTIHHCSLLSPFIGFLLRNESVFEIMFLGSYNPPPRCHHHHRLSGNEIHFTPKCMNRSPWATRMGNCHNWLPPCSEVGSGRRKDGSRKANQSLLDELTDSQTYALCTTAGNDYSGNSFYAISGRE